ncbi:hypothetical protein AGMMS50262_12790 [Bacteroidia bacterium]|nr:hypothetical protein AGMMS50262_12790 [Bacteroidia bacterium]
MKTQFLFIGCLLLLVVSTKSYAIGGTDGAITWQLEDSVLTISGEGEMPRYDSPLMESNAPWTYYASSIKQIIVGDSVTSIGKYAFYSLEKYYENLVLVHLGRAVNKIGAGAFAYCFNLSSIILPNDLTSIGYNAFMGCGITSLVFPSSMITIEGAAFRRCSYLTSITIPIGVTTVREETFDYCSKLSSVIIPKSVTHIQKFAFANCGNLNQVEVDWEFPTRVRIDNAAFDQTDLTDVTLVVPYGMKEAYEHEDVWKDFGKIVERTTAIRPIDASTVFISVENGNLQVISPETESINVYSVSGQLLFQSMKAAGEAAFPINTIQDKVLIVKGSSGWVRKVIQQ